jgi:hypothetical protein
MACGSTTFSATDSDDASTSGDTSTIDGDSATLRDASFPDATDEPAPLGFCRSFSPSRFFCADFDETDPRQTYVNGAPTDGVVTATGGGVVGTKSGGRSAPNVLTSLIPTSPASATATFSAVLPDAPTATHLRLDLDFRIDTQGDISSDQAENFVSIAVSNTSGTVTSTCVLAFHASTIVASVGAINMDMGLPAEGAWVHAILDLDLSGNMFTATVDATTKNTSTLLTGDTHAIVNVGLVAPSSGVGTSVSYDNVTLIADKGDAG